MNSALFVSLLVCAAPANQNTSSPTKPSESGNRNAEGPNSTLSKMKKLEGNWTASDAQLSIRVLAGGKAISVTLTNSARTIEHLMVVHEEASEVVASYFSESGASKLKAAELAGTFNLNFDSGNGTSISFKLKGDSELTFEATKPTSKSKKAFTREYVDALK
jgi:hypothetical protein